MDSSEEDDPIEAFFKGKLINKVKTAKHNFTAAKIEEKETKIEITRYFNDDIEEDKYVEERKMLTEFLNVCNKIDDTLGIEDGEETRDFKAENDLKFIYQKYEFSIPRMNLPIAEKYDLILRSIKHNKVIILKCDTGCGKSSQVPQYILEDCFRKNAPCNIIITQPKKISAESLANRVAFERKCEIGSLVGYQIGLDKKMDTHDTRILYCTTGVFLHKLVHYKSLQQWTHVIIDEIHERDLDMDMVLLIIRRLMITTKSRVKIILMSATLNTEKISNYFKLVEKPAVIDLNIRKPFPVKIHYLNELEHLGCAKEFIDMNEPGISRNMFRLGADIIDFFIQKGANSFLIFLPGIFEIETFQRELCSKLDVKNFRIFILHSSIPVKNMQILYDASLKNKIVLATNIAESSVTIPGIQIVIDYALTKYLEVDSSSSLTQLKLSWASKMNLEQRCGRVGRTGLGQVIRMLYEDHYELLPSEGKAEMQRNSLENVILKIKNLQMGRPTDILAISLDPPSRSAIVSSILLLKECGALTRFNKRKREFDFLDGNLTFAGAIMSKLPMDIRLSKLIVLGYVFSVMNECIIIAAGLSVSSIFQHENSMNAYETRLSHDTSSDLIGILNAYNKYMEWTENNRNESVAVEERWCKNQMLNYKNVKEMTRQIEDIKRRIKQFNVIHDSHRYTTEDKLFAIKMCIAGAFYPNIYSYGGKMPGREEFKQVYNKNLCSSVYFQAKKSTKNGHLYEEQFRDLLYNLEITNCADDACVTFDSSSQKVFVQFENLRHDDVHKMPGDVKLEVYKALKYRSLKKSDDLKILMMSPENEEIFSPLEQREDLIYGETANADLRLKAKFNIYPSLTLRPEEKELFLCGEILHIISPSKFYFAPRKAITLRNKMKKVIGSNLQNINDIDEAIEKNRIMMLHNDEFKRSQILELPTDNHSSFKVLLIDYGQVVDGCSIEDFYTGRAANKNQRQDILRDFFKMPALCYECKLAEIQPTAKQQYGWNKKATDEFKQIVDGKNIKLILFGFNAYDKVAAVEVFVKNNLQSPLLSANANLVHKGLAVYSNESYATMISKTLSDNTQAMKYEIHKESSSIEIPKKFLEIQNVLLGPFSPLESSGRLEKHCRLEERDFVIDNSSINCHLVDPYPYDGVKKVLVASAKSKTHRGVVTLRQTTMMPFMRGMGSIIALIFGPCGEIRCDKDKTRYTSILTGLGCDYTGKPYYGEHDCLIRTDIEIDGEDLESVNKLRTEMSFLMQMNDDFEYRVNPVNVMLQSRTHACSLLLKIMKKERLQLGEIYTDNYDWKFFTKREASEYQKVFPCHNGLELAKISKDRLKFVMFHLKDLEQKGKYNCKDEIVECKACEERLETLIELRNHLLTIKHNEMKAKYHNLDRDDGSRN